MAPSDGMYDVTWWFHCGKNDNFGDTGCGGAPHTASGCRPHIFEINGAKFPKAAAKITDDAKYPSPVGFVSLNRPVQPSALISQGFTCSRRIGNRKL